MIAAILRADCERCAALCCVALAFDRSTMFAFDKPAGEPCRNLDDCGGCRIYDERERQGFAGCLRYDCFGAGQRVTQEVFKGQSWRDDRSLLGPMTRAFGTMRRVHDLLLLLGEAGKLELSAGERGALRTLESQLEPAGAWTQETLAALRLDDIDAQVRGFLASLRERVAPDRPDKTS